MSTVIDHINLDLNNDGKTERYDLASGASVHMEDGSTVVINNGNATSYDVHVSNFEYSEEERVVGCWTDGKPMYERTVSITIDVPSQNTILYFTGDYIADNIEYITIIRSFTNNSVSYGSSGYINSSNKRTQFYIDNGYIRACSDRTVDTGVWRIVVQYTKSTDLPNSFKPSMLNIKSIVPQHNYSTEEKIVGTWIDGKPIYEKTINAGHIGLAHGQLIEHNIDNIGTVIHGNVIFKDDADSTMPFTAISELNGFLTNSNSNHASLGFRVNTKYIMVMGGNTWAQNDGRTVYIILQYTKTTD